MAIRKVEHVNLPYAGRRTTPDYSRLSALYSRGGEVLADIALRKGDNAARMYGQLAGLFTNYQETGRQKKATEAATALRREERAAEEKLKRDEMAERKAEREAAAKLLRDAKVESEAKDLIMDTPPGPISDTDPRAPALAQAAQLFPGRFGLTPRLPATPLAGEMVEAPPLLTRTPTGVEQRQSAIDAATQAERAAVADRAATDDARQAAAATATEAHRRVMERAAQQRPQGPQPAWQWVMRDGKEVYTNRVMANDRPQTNRVKATEDERKTAGFYGQMSDAIKTIDELEADITEPELYQIQTLPHEKLVGMMNRNQLSEAAKRYLRAFEQFTESRLRPVSGAAIADTEYERDRRTYAKQYGETPKLAEDRKRARIGALDALKKRAGVALDDANQDTAGGDIEYGIDGNPIKKP